MIKFFRRIRQSLILENKTGKYFKYAIGEIILVVIGILIAVQINSSVNNRQLKIGNKVLLEKMVTELELNKKRMHKLMYGDTNSVDNARYLSLEKAILNCDTLLKMIYKGLDSTNVSFILNNRIGSGGAYLNLHNSIYEELINTGKLYTIGSDSLITAIKNYYKRCERENLYNIGNTETVSDGFDLINNTYYLLRLDYYMDSTKFKLRNYPWYFNKNSENYQNLKLALNKIRSGQSNNFYKMNQIKDYSDTLINKIQSELKLNHD